MTNEQAKDIIEKYLALDSDVDSEYIQAQKVAVEALKQELILDKIRAEIEHKAHSSQWSDATMYGMLKAVAIIDKYKAESEG